MSVIFGVEDFRRIIAEPKNPLVLRSDIRCQINAVSKEIKVGVDNICMRNRLSRSHRAIVEPDLPKQRFQLGTREFAIDAHNFNVDPTSSLRDSPLSDELCMSA